MIIKPIGRSAAGVDLPSDGAEPEDKHRVLDAAYANPNFRLLIEFARDLIALHAIDDVLTRALAVAFEALPVHRGVIVLRQPNGEVLHQISRVRERVERGLDIQHPVSRTLMDQVMQEQVAIVTQDALRDERFDASGSIWGAGIRSAMCVPLWAQERIIGVMQVDSPLWVRTFNERDLDFLITVANLTAVAIERIREHHARTRLQRYHAPAVIEQVLRADDARSGRQSLKKAEVTVLFADLAGFTAIAETATPEEVAELLGGFCTRSAEAVFAEGGTLDKFIGDCVMAFFGAPAPMADHAACGVRAAMRLQTAMERWSAQRAGLGLPELRVRIGVNSGPVVVGDIGNEQRADYTVLGNTVNVAARLEQSVAAPGEIVVADATRRLLGDAFRLESLGDVALRGLGKNVAAHRVCRPGAIPAAPLDCLVG